MKKSITSDWKQFTPVYFFTSVVAFIGWAIWFAEAVSLGEALGLLAIGFISWSFVEYGLHRFVFHYDAKSELGRKIIYYQHLEHHDYPRKLEQLFANLSTSVPVSSVYFLIVWSLLGSWQRAGCVYVGLIIGYFLYEFLHYQAHHMSPRLGVLRYLKKYHLLHHHHREDRRYGVTTPLLDILFGTYEPVPVKRFKEFTAKLSPVAAVRRVGDKAERVTACVADGATRVSKRVADKATEVAGEIGADILPRSGRVGMKF